MTTNMKVMIAAIAVAVLASPAMAQQSGPHSRAAAASLARAHGSVAGARVFQPAPSGPARWEPAREGGYPNCNIYSQCGHP